MKKEYEIRKKKGTKGERKKDGNYLELTALYENKYLTQPNIH